MKKLILPAFLFLSFIDIHAQGGYLRLGTGYGWNAFQKTGQVITFQPGPGATGIDPANSLIVNMINQSISDSSKSQYKSNVNDGYSRGVNMTITGGYMINPYFGIELGVTYLVGATIKSTYIYDEKTPGSPIGINASLKTTTNTTGLSLMPGLYFRAAKPTAKVAPFARLALALPVYGKTVHDLLIDAPNGAFGKSSSELSVTTQSTVSLGINGGVGVSYTPIPLISIWAEMNGQYLFVRPAKATVTKYSLTLGGTTTDKLTGDQTLPDGTKSNVPAQKISTYSTVTEFVNKLDESSNTTIFGKGRTPISGPVAGKSYVDETKPRQELRTSANLSSIGFNIGITFNLGKTILASYKKKKEAK